MNYNGIHFCLVDVYSWGVGGVRARRLATVRSPIAISMRVLRAWLLLVAAPCRDCLCFSAAGIGDRTCWRWTLLMLLFDLAAQSFLRGLRTRALGAEASVLQIWGIENNSGAVTWFLGGDSFGFR